MDLDTKTIEQATKFIIPYANQIFKKHISPFLEDKLRSFYKNRRNKARIEKSINKYFSSLYVDCAYINTIAFQNIPKKLNEIYLPLTLISEISEEEFKIADTSGLTNTYNRILIQDSAGMGKSTVVKKIVLEAILSKNHIPFYFELRAFTETTDIEKLVEDTIGFPKDTKLSAISHMPYIVVLDGFDEIALDLRKKAIEDIYQFSKKYKNIPMIKTSRPDDYITSLKGFDPFKIKHLEEVEAYELLKKFDDSGALSGKLISGLESSGRTALKDYLTSPLYVSLLFCAYKNKPIIPRRSHLFYSQVFDALFESHDLTKEPGYAHEKYSGLDSNDFHMVLRRLSFWCLTNEMKIEFLKDHLITIISSIEKNCPGVTFRSEDFVKDLLQTVPLFVKDGNMLRWAHKSLMEYFVAMFICYDSKDHQADILMKLYNDQSVWSYLNILELCCDIDYPTFRKTILKEILTRFLIFCEKHYNNLKNKRIKKEWIMERKGLSFPSKIMFLIEEESKSIKKSLIEEIMDLGSEELKRKYNLNRIGLQITITGMPYNLTIFSVKDGNIDHTLLSYVKDKETDLFNKPEHSINEFKHMIKSSIPKNKMITVDDDPKNIINNSRNFPIINNALYSIIKYGSINHKAAKSIIDKISEDSTCGLKDLLKCFKT